MSSTEPAMVHVESTDNGVSLATLTLPRHDDIGVLPRPGDLPARGAVARLLWHHRRVWPDCDCCADLEARYGSA